MGGGRPRLTAASRGAEEASAAGSALTAALFAFNCSYKSSQPVLAVGGDEVYGSCSMSLKGIRQLAGNSTAIPFFLSHNTGSNHRFSVQLGGPR